MSRFFTTLAILLSLSLTAVGPGWCKKEGVVLAPKTEQQHQAGELLVQGSQLLKNKQPFKAKKLLEQATQMWPDLGSGWFNLGLCYTDCGEFQKAVDAYKQALRFDKSITECYVNIGTCYQMMDQASQAIPWFEEYLHKEPHAKDAPQVAGMIGALKSHTAKQIDSNAQAYDYLPSVCPRGHIQRWQRKNVPIKVFISNGTDEVGRPIPGFRDYYNEILVDSLDSWMRASGGRLAYHIVDDVKDANIICSWTDKPDFLQEAGNAVEQGAARIAARPISDQEDEIGNVRVIIMITDAQNKGQNIPDDFIKMTCLHELGHALGLAGHSTNNRDVMFFSEASTVWAALTKRDKATISRLYADYPIQTPQQAPLQHQQYAVQQQMPPQQQYAMQPQPQYPPQQQQYMPPPPQQQNYAQPQYMPPQQQQPHGMPPPYPPQY